MIIEWIRIDKFGKLRGLEMELGDGLTVIFGGNESGKTTMAAFVRAMLYGLNGKSASVAQNERKKYMPWGETAMGGSLRLKCGQERYEIVRVFGQTKKSDTCRMVNADTGEILPLPAGQEPGQMLLGIEESVFVDTLFVSSRGAGLESGTALGERIRSRMDTGSEEADFAAILERLQAARSEILPRIREKGELAQVRRELNGARQQLMQEKALREEEARLQKELEQQPQERGTALRRAWEENGRDIRRQEELLAEQERKERAAQKAARRKALWFGIAAGIVAAGSLVGGFLWSKWVLLGLMAAAGLTVCASVCAFGGRKQQRASVDYVMAQLSQLRQDQLMLMQQMQALPAEMSAPKEEWVRSRLKLEQVRKDLEALKGVRQTIAALEEKEKELLTIVQALDMAQEELRAAEKERRQGELPELMQYMEEMLPGLTGGRYQTAAIADGMELSVRTQDGGLHTWEYFSAGAAEQMYLALRLSLVRQMERTHGLLPVILDDAFAHYDDERAEDALALLMHYAADGRQVLLMTCRQRDAKHVSRVVRMEA